MYSSDIDVITKMAEKKARNANEKTGKYIGRAVVTGFYIMVAIILSYTTGAILYPKYPEVSKVIVAATFCFAIALIVFLSGELFTGNNFVMIVGMLKGKVKFSSSLKDTPINIYSKYSFKDSYKEELNTTHIKLLL